MMNTKIKIPLEKISLIHKILNVMKKLNRLIKSNAVSKEKKKHKNNY